MQAAMLCRRGGDFAPVSEKALRDALKKLSGLRKPASLLTDAFAGEGKSPRDAERCSPSSLGFVRRLGAYTS